jgi:hypothetical protein
VAGNAAVSGGLQVGTTTTDASFEGLGGVYATPAVEQQQLTDNGSVGGGFWQSFTAGTSGHVQLSAGAGTGGTLLTLQTVVLAPQQAYLLSTPAPVVAGRVYTYQVQPLSSNYAYLRVTTTNVYAGATTARTPTGMPYSRPTWRRAAGALTWW